MNTEKTALTAIITGAIAVFAPVGPFLKLSLGVVSLVFGALSLTSVLRTRE